MSVLRPGQPPAGRWGKALPCKREPRIMAEASARVQMLCGNRESGIGNRESGVGNRESGIGNRESGIGTPNSELRTPNSELRTQNSELRTQNSELRTPNSQLRPRKTRPAAARCNRNQAGGRDGTIGAEIATGATNQADAPAPCTRSPPARQAQAIASPACRSKAMGSSSAVSSATPRLAVTCTPSRPCG